MAGSKHVRVTCKVKIEKSAVNETLGQLASNINNQLGIGRRDGILPEGEGAEKCAMDDPVSENTVCGHVVCDEAKDGGLSPWEYTTIIDYKQRIQAAKTMRRKHALRKQRDNQLIQDKQIGDECVTKTMKKFGYTGKGPGDSKPRATSPMESKQLDRLPLEENIQADNGVEQLGRALSQLRLQALSPGMKLFHDILQHRLTSRLSSYYWRNPVQYLEAFGAVEVVHLEAAVMNVRDILEMNAVLTYEIEYRLRSLLSQFWKMLQEVPHNRRFTPNMTVADALYEISHSITFKKQPTGKAKGHNAARPQTELLCVLETCDEIGARARSRMREVNNRMPTDNDQNPEDEFTAAKAEALSKTHLPSLTEKLLEYEIWQGWQYHCLFTFVDYARNQDVPQLSKFMGRSIRSQARDHDKSLNDVFDELNLLHYNLHLTELGLSYKTAHAKLRQVFDDGQLSASLSGEQAKLSGWLQPKDSNVEDRERINSVFARLEDHIEIVQHLPGMPLVRELTLSLLDSDFFQHRRICGTHHSWRKLITLNCWSGLSQAFHAYQGLSTAMPPELDQAVLRHLKAQARCDAQKFGDQDYNIITFFRGHRSQGLCVSLVIVQLCLMLPEICAMNPLTAKDVLRQLRSIQHNPSLQRCLPREWVQALRAVIPILLYMYGSFILEATLLFGRSDVEQVAFSMLWLVVIHASFATSTDQAWQQYLYAADFVKLVFETKASTSSPWSESIDARMHEIIKVHQLRCPSPTECLVARPQEISVGPYIQSKCTESVEHTEQVALAYTTFRTRKTALSRYQVQIRTIEKVVRGNRLGKASALRLLKQIAAVYQSGQVRKDPRALQVLWHAFAKSEAALGLPPQQTLISAPMSLSLGMHNQCNIWELCTSPIKAYGFFQGCHYGLRDTRDIATMLDSAKCFALQQGEPGAVRCVYEILECHAYWDNIVDYQDAFLNLMDEIGHGIDNSKLLCAKRLDRILGMMPMHETPCEAFLQDLYKCDEEAFREYLRCLHAIIASFSTVKDFDAGDSRAVDAIVHLMSDLENKREIMSGTTEFKALSDASLRIWHDSEHDSVLEMDFWGLLDDTIDGLYRRNNESTDTGPVEDGKHQPKTTRASQSQSPENPEYIARAHRVLRQTLDGTESEAHGGPVSNGQSSRVVPVRGGYVPAETLMNLVASGECEPLETSEDSEETKNTKYFNGDFAIDSDDEPLLPVVGGWLKATEYQDAMAAGAAKHIEPPAGIPDARRILWRHAGRAASKRAAKYIPGGKNPYEEGSDTGEIADDEAEIDYETSTDDDATTPKKPLAMAEFYKAMQPRAFADRSLQAAAEAAENADKGPVFRSRANAISAASIGTGGVVDGVDERMATYRQRSEELRKNLESFQADIAQGIVAPDRYY